MAYGVKYRLTFGDVAGKDFRLEIHKDGYSGTVLDLVGGESPVIIEWQSNDDIYFPIIGSICKINLIKTSGVTYEEFYNNDEKEFQVHIFCFLSGAYTLIWKGWLVSDLYREAVLSEPYPLQLTAVDGLGFLKNFSVPNYDKGGSPYNLENSQNPYRYILDILTFIDLELDIYLSNELVKNGSETLPIYDTIWTETADDDQIPYGFMKSAETFMNAYEALIQILNFTHSRVFQSFGRWYVINKSGYSEQSIKDDLLDGTFNPASGSIRTQEYNSLVANNTETIKYFVRPYSGSSSTSEVDVLFQIPDNNGTNELTPINLDFTREMIRPLEKVSFVNSLQNRLEFLNPNPFLQWTQLRSGNYVGWDVTDANVSFVTTNPYKNEVSLKWTGSATVESSTFTMVKRSVGGVYKFRIAYLTLTNPIGAIQYRLSGYNGSQTVYFDESDNTFSKTSVVNNSIQTNEFIWNDHSVEIPDISPHASHTTYTNCKIELIGTTGDIVNICGVFIDFDSEELTGLYAPRANDLSKLIYELKRNSGDYSLNNVLPDSTFSDFIPANYIKGDSILTVRRPVDEFNDDSFRLHQIIAQYILNDHRDFIPRYEGTLYNEKDTPLLPHNKVWVNFGSSLLQEKVSCYIDAMKYDLRKNTHQVIMHVPNQDDDLASTLTRRYE